MPERKPKPTALRLIDDGLGLSISEHKALSAIQRLLDKTRYKGTRWPRLSFTWREYFEAYGLEEYQQHGRQRDEARKALLEGLTKRRLVCYRRYEGAGQSRRTVMQIVSTRAPLVRFYEYFEGLTEEEASRVEAGEPMMEQVKHVVVDVSPMLLVGIKNFFLLKPTGGKPVARAVSLFIEWLEASLLLDEGQYHAWKEA